MKQTVRYSTRSITYEIPMIEKCSERVERTDIPLIALVREHHGECGDDCKYAVLLREHDVVEAIRAHKAKQSDEALAGAGGLR